MAAVYPHKSRGFQVRFTLFFPDGSQATRYRYVHSRPEADRLRRDCDFLEADSRSGRLSSREIAQARRDGLISDVDARAIMGGKLSNVYDIDLVLDKYRDSIRLSHTPVAFEKAEAKAELISIWLRKNPIPSLTDSDVKRYVLDRREGNICWRNSKTGRLYVGVSAKTIKNEIQMLCGLIDEAVKLGMVESNVARGIIVPVKASTLKRAMSLQEIEKLLATAQSNRHLMHGQIYEFLMVALYTGFRRSELRTLCWEDVDFDTKRILVQSKPIPDEPDFTPKSGTARYKSIPDKLLGVLQSMARKGRFVFGGDRPYHVDSISQVVRLVMRRAGLPGLSLHHCRHTYGSWILRKTGDLKYVQEEMGHLDIGTTKQYMHTIESDDPARSFDYE